MEPRIRIPVREQTFSWIPKIQEIHFNFNQDFLPPTTVIFLQQYVFRLALLIPTLNHRP